ncbi:MAG TPA: hypothetical protein VE221_01085 [Sphingomicrobium sp.]|nr:hypothetical protein [Sphingomicrobium sp.]
MKRILLASRLPALALAGGYLAAAAPAAGQATAQAPGETGEQPAIKSTTTFLDVSAGVGYSSNPLLELQGRSSAFARLSLNAFHSWNSERGSTSLSGYVEDTSYLRGGYGSKDIFSLDARTHQAVSERVQVSGDLSFSGDIAGQLENRFTTPVPVTPPPPETTPPIATTPEIFNFSGRQYRLSGQVGASIATGVRSNVTLSASATHGFFTGQNKLADYTTYLGSFGYNHQLTEFTWIGADVSVQRQDFRGGNYANIVNPTATLRTQLGQNINASGSVGLLAIYDYRDGVSEHSYSPSFTASICRSGEKSQFCLNASRDATVPIGFGVGQGVQGASINTNLGLNYTRPIGRGGSIRATLTATRDSTVDRLQTGKFTSTYLTGLVGYDRKVGHRLFAGVQAGVRRLYETGPDPSTDFNGSVYLRYRLGDLL